MENTFKMFMELSVKDRTTLLNNLLTEYHAELYIELHYCERCNDLSYSVNRFFPEILKCGGCASTFCEECSNETMDKRVCESCSNCICKKCAENTKTCEKCKMFFCGECTPDLFDDGDPVCLECK